MDEPEAFPTRISVGDLALVLRRPVAADTALLAAMHEACFRPLVEPRFDWDALVQAERLAVVGESWMVEVGDAVIGSLVLQVRAEDVFLERIMIHPDWQGRGLGTGLVGAVMDHARRLGVPVTLSVWDTNPARELYLRLGFVLTEKVEFRLKMRWEPD
jgi:GNAT superfamily N-acetyltransferase